MKNLFPNILLPLLASSIFCYALPSGGHANNNPPVIRDTSHILDGPDLSTRSMTTNAACNGIATRPRDGAWKFDQAYCDRNGQAGDRRRYTVVCAASNDQANTREVELECGPNQKCIQRPGVNYFGDDVEDVVCVDNENVREWIINAAHKISTNIGCSGGYNVEAQPGLKLDVAINVYDSNGQNKIVAQDVYFEIDSSRVPVDGEGAHSIFEGKVFVKYHNSLQACVQGKTGQVLSIISGLIGTSR